MALPRTVVRDRKIILLSGYSDEAAGRTDRVAIKIDAEDKLRRAVERHLNAVAFGCVAGEWVAGA